MATQPKICIEYEADASKITVTEDTGAYDINNEGGHGAPNPERSDVASVLLVYYQSYDSEKELIIDMSDIVRYDANYDNNEQSQWQIPFLNDGWYQFILASVPESITPVEGRIIYSVSNNALRQYDVDLNLVEVYDISLLDNPAIYPLVKKDDFPLPKIKTYANKKAKEYFLGSDCNDCEFSQELQDILSLDRDIQTQIYYFNVSPFEAQKRIEALTKELKLK